MASRSSWRSSRHTLLGARPGAAAWSACGRRPRGTSRDCAAARSFLGRYGPQGRARSPFRPRHACGRRPSPRFHPRVRPRRTHHSGRAHGARRCREKTPSASLLRIAARGYGIGTAQDLADYFRMYVRDARPRIDELVESGELREVRVEGWRQLAYLDPGARLPARIECREPAIALRPGHLVSSEGRPVVRLRLPRRDLRAAVEAAMGRLCAAVPDGRAPGGPRRPESRPRRSQAGRRWRPTANRTPSQAPWPKHSPPS